MKTKDLQFYIVSAFVVLVFLRYAAWGVLTTAIKSLSGDLLLIGILLVAAWAVAESKNNKAAQRNRI